MPIEEAVYSPQLSGGNSAIKNFLTRSAGYQMNCTGREDAVVYITKTLGEANGNRSVR